MTADGTILGASAAFRDYLSEVGRDLAAGNATEHTHRPALKSLLIALDPAVHPVNEPTRIECGAPDFIVTRNDLPVGYLEAKDVGRSLDEIERDEQLTRYRESLSNLILTDYLEFRWYKDGEKHQSARIAYVGDSGTLRPDRDGQKQAAALFGTFLAQEPPIVGKPEDLAKRMAALTRIIRQTVGRALDHDRSGGSPLREQLDGFRRVLIHDLSEDQFADMYAQTIAYGLFAARVNAPVGEHFSRRHAAYDLPKTNPFLRQMFGQIAGPELDERITWVVDDLGELLARARMDRVLEDFGKRTRQEDPVVHFYETFLAAYDPKMREARGVYYTPEPVVSYIVRSVDHILKTQFGLKAGIADKQMIEIPTPDGKGRREIHKVQVLDPAAGTGTFLAQVMEKAYESFAGNEGMWPGYVHEHLLPRLYGFELLMAPYAIAHLKIGMRLKEKGYDIDQSERLRVYLTNSLEEAHDRQTGQLSLLATWLAQEADDASEIKRDVPVMVVLGNPPYSGISANMSPDGARLVDAYKFVDGQPLGERKHWLQDDYVKFFRFAQLRIEATGYGILAFVTNHGYLDNPTFRGMRQSLMGSFDQLYVLDLHGNSKKKERSPDGSPDENVFDIQQGVAIGIFVKRGSSGGSSVVSRSDMWGDRESKYERLLEESVATTEWETIEPQAPMYLFASHDTEFEEEYESGWHLRRMMPFYSPGIITARDGFVIDVSRDQLEQRMGEFADLSIDDGAIRAKYFTGKGSPKYLPGDTRGWKLVDARRKVSADDFRASRFRECLYRPFDVRWVYYSPDMVDWPRQDATAHMLAGPNRALIATRQTKDHWGTHVSSEIVCHKSFAAYDINDFFPLYLYPMGGHEGSASVNLSDEFVAAAASALGQQFVSSGTGDLSSTFGPNDVFHYMYAVFHSDTYGRRYSSFLKTDFPRLPLTTNGVLFRELCGLGAHLVALHLMEREPKLITTYPRTGDNRVERVHYDSHAQGEQSRVWINQTQYFAGVLPELWNCHVGGFQVCERWLKDRKGRMLNYHDLTHYQRIVSTLAETNQLTRRIDEVIDERGGWPIR